MAWLERMTIGKDTREFDEQNKQNVNQIGDKYIGWFPTSLDYFAVTFVPFNEASHHSILI
jgi:hypothetical protein